MALLLFGQSNSDIQKKYGSRTAVYFFAIMLYTFVLYMTDNTEHYYICSLIRTTAPLAYVLENSKRRYGLNRLMQRSKMVMINRDNSGELRWKRC